MTTENYDKKIAELETKIGEANSLIIKFAQFTSGVVSALIIAFENHSHDENGIVLPDDIKAAYESFIPQGLNHDNI